MMKRLACLPVLLVLSGCLLTQTDPAPHGDDKPPKPILLGAAVMEDMYISNMGGTAMFTAEFANKTPEPTAAVQTTMETLEGRKIAIARAFAETGRGPSCRKQRGKKVSPSPKPDSVPSGPTRVSVGQLGFGPVLQSTLMILDPSQDPKTKNKYAARLESGIAAGAYQMLSDGTPETNPFAEILSMPEPVQYLRIAGRDFGDPTAEVRLGNGLELFWKDPTITNDQNGVITEIISEDADYVYDLSCVSREEDVPSVSGYKNWNLDKAWFAEFPKTGKAVVYFVRAHLRMPETTGTKMQLQGARTYVSENVMK